MSRNKTVLIIENDHEFRVLLRTALEGDGYTVVSAGNGVSALELLKSNPIPPCLILLDLMLPILSGLDVLLAIKADPLLAAIPVVVMTALEGAFVPPEKLEVQGYIKKPASLEHFVETVRQHCGSHAAG